MNVLLRCLRLEEGFSAAPYTCPAGRRTIGYGHNLDANPLTENDRDALGLGDGPLELTTAQAEALLVRDVDRLVVPAAHNLLGADHWVTMGQVRRAALGSMIYQLGESGFGQFRDLRSYVRRYDWAGAAAASLASKYAKQTPARARRVAFALMDNVDMWGKK